MVRLNSIVQKRFWTYLFRTSLLLRSSEGYSGKSSDEEGDELHLEGGDELRSLKQTLVKYL